MEGPVEIHRRESIKPASSLQRLSNDGNPLLANGSISNSGSVIANGYISGSPESYTGYLDVRPSESIIEQEDEETVLAVNCRVCQREIVISEEEGFVVKCPSCNEATPIRNAPVGEKYVRCPCRCLLICKDSSEKIACPRPNCKRIITITASEARPKSSTFQDAGTVRVICIHCYEDFLFNIIHKSLAKCPHCSKISAVGNDFRRRQLRIYTGVALLFILITACVIVATGFLVKESGGIVALYIGLVAISVLALVRVAYFCRMKVSEVQGVAPDTPDAPGAP